MCVRRREYNEKSYAEVGDDFGPLICVNNACQLYPCCESSARPAASYPFANKYRDWAADSRLYVDSLNQIFRDSAAISLPNSFKYRTAHTHVFTNPLAQAIGI
jgi:hypothetical protein